MSARDFVFALVIGLGGLSVIYCLLFDVFYKALKK